MRNYVNHDNLRLDTSSASTMIHACQAASHLYRVLEIATYHTQPTAEEMPCILTLRSAFENVDITKITTMSSTINLGLFGLFILKQVFATGKAQIRALRLVLRFSFSRTIRTLKIARKRCCCL
jgi:hypothetical protein